VNPVVAEAAAMACAQVIGNDATITVAGQSGNFQLNVMLPVVAYNLLQSLELLAERQQPPGRQGDRRLHGPRGQARRSPGSQPDPGHRAEPVIGYEKGAASPNRLTPRAVPIIDVALEQTDLDRATLAAPARPGLSFPGGRIEPSDAGPAEAALRETDEEVGIAACEVDLLGYLDTYVTGTGFAVTPVVGLVDPSAQPQANADEVAEAFEVPLSYLIDPTNHQSTSRALHGQVIEFIEITYQRHRIWGATAGIIVGFYEKLID
jgi:8-oxo-dGTP pyrophosphatase MutT (NUDIX family)